MDYKQIVSVGGVAFGLGLAASRVTKWAIGGPSSRELILEDLVKEMRNLIICGKDNKITLKQFPYSVSEQTKSRLISAAICGLSKGDLSRHTRNLSLARRRVMLSGTAELYQQMLAKALANFMKSKLLILDITDFSLKIVSKYGANRRDNILKRSISEATLRLEWVSEISGSFTILPKEEGKGKQMAHQVNPNLPRNASASCDMNNLSTQSTSALAAPINSTTSSAFDDKLLIEALYQVLSEVSNTSPVILYLRDVEKFLCRSERIHTLFQKMLKKLEGPVLILGSRIVHTENNIDQVNEQLASLFPYNIGVRPPENETRLLSWKTLLKEDENTILYQETKNHIIKVLAANDIECYDLGSICVTDTMAICYYIEEIVVSAIYYHLMNNNDPEYRNGKLIISARSLSKELSVFQEGKPTGMNYNQLEAKTQNAKEEVADKKPDQKTGSKVGAGTGKDAKDAGTKKDAGEPKGLADNEFEKRIRSEVIPASKIDVTFDDIGALDDVKESLQELVMLPIRRPDLFKGELLKPCKGILLFGPPGTGKTMLAKAIAKEAGASFINISASTIASKWFGEDEKIIRAIFTVAAKVCPAIIFIDEVDSLLSERSNSEHDACRKIKNEFMIHWDGLLTEADQRIVVLGATNRPFDLDDAVIRRFERRIMVGLPTAKNREVIFKTLLAKEKGVDARLDFKQLATMTEGYTGSDLKNLCRTAAYRPVTELIQKEKLRDLDKKSKANEISKEADDNAKSSDVSEGDKEERVIDIRPLSMEDFKEAKNQVSASLSSRGRPMELLRSWNKLHGGGEASEPEILTYFL